MDSGLKLWGIMTASAIVLASDSPTLVKAAARLAKVVFGDLIQICDNSDDDVEIQAAIDACDALTRGGPCQLLGNEFTTSATINLKPSVPLYGSGLDNTKIALAASSNCDMLLFTPTADEQGWIDLKGFSLDGNSASQSSGHGIHFAVANSWKIYDPVIERVFVKDCKEDGIYVEGAKALVMRDVFTEYNLGDGLDITANPFFLYDIYAAWNGGVGIKTAGTHYASSAHDVYAGANTGYGMFLGAQYAKYFGLSASSNTDHAILAQCYDCAFFGITTVSTAGGKQSVFVSRDRNRFTGCQTDAEFYLTNTADSNIVVGNDFYSFRDLGTLNTIRHNKGVKLEDEKEFVLATNASGGNLVKGDVVSRKASASGNEFTDPTAVGEDLVMGMLAADIDDAANGYLQVLGKTVDLKATNAVGGNIALGDFLCTENGNRAQKAGAGDMAFAIALEICEAADVTIDALLIVPRKI